ncbi:MAG TPA: CBS domain-containing protein [Acidimicrobiales bacterium]|nr:CBS domain-containing protein [Acidimicrobiales bacterium]
MTTAREVMTPTADFIEPDKPLADAAREMAREDVGALPVCDNGRLVGMLTDRDIVVRAIADGRDPATTKVSDIVERTEVVTIGADDSIEEAIKTMKEHAVRRLPVIDGTTLVGMLSQGDVAQAVSKSKAGDLVGNISAQPANN